jgi:FMN phosphatase YigB (HAD superfamily)
MAYKAIFFDRDGTLTHANPEKQKWRDEVISSWSGKPFTLPYDKLMALFEQAAQGQRPWFRDVDEERAFFRRYWACLLRGEGVRYGIEVKAELLFNELWCNNDRCSIPR